MNNEELHQQAFELAVKLWPHMNKDELALLCHFFGERTSAVTNAAKALKAAYLEGQIEAAEAREDR